MIIVDSFGWIEYLSDGPLTNKYEKYLSDLTKVITPTIVLYEVYKKIKNTKYKRGREGAVSCRPDNEDCDGIAGR